MIARLERSLSRFAIPGIIRYVVALNALVFLLGYLTPGYQNLLALDRAAILHGEIWRVVSWIFIPSTFGFPWIIFYLMFTWWLGDMLEQTWGTFRLNLYYFLGVLLCVASAFLLNFSGGNILLSLSLLLAVATLAPDLQILLLIIPVRIKWVALFSLAFPILSVLGATLAAKLGVVLCLGNYILFFGPGALRGAQASKENRSRRQKFEAAKLSADAALHACSVCGATEVSHPDADFRVSADGHEYCTDHLPIRR